MAGLTEEAAAAQDIDYEVDRGWFERNPKSILAGATKGLIKLVFRRITRELLGVHILGDIASELTHQGQSVIHHGGMIDQLFTQPTTCPPKARPTSTPRTMVFNGPRNGRDHERDPAPES